MEGPEIDWRLGMAWPALAGLGRAVMSRDIAHVSGPVWSHALSSGSPGATEYSALDFVGMQVAQDRER